MDGLVEEVDGDAIGAGLTDTPLRVVAADAHLRALEDVLILCVGMQLARSPRHLSFELEASGFHHVLIDAQLALPREDVGVLVVADEGEHVVALPFGAVGTALEGTAGNEHLVPRIAQLALQRVVVGVHHDGVAVFLERHHPAVLRLVGSERIGEAVVDEVRIDKLRAEEARLAFAKLVGGHHLQFAGIQLSGEAELSVGAFRQLLCAARNGRARGPQVVKLLRAGWQAYDGRKKKDDG